MPLPVQQPAEEKMKKRVKSIARSLDRVGSRIAVLSGKGGVGKTTVAVNVAGCLAQESSVSLLDADIDCPNVGKLLGIREMFRVEDGFLIPKEKHGMHVASMSFFSQDESVPTIWRGPLIHNAILQLIEKCKWPESDYMIIDMPPGTSDAALTVMKYLKPTAAVVVTTPQKLAVTDARKSANMASEHVEKIGVVENMAGFFGSGAGERLASELNAAFLGRVELSESVAKAAENSELSTEEFSEIAKNLKAML